MRVRNKLRRPHAEHTGDTIRFQGGDRGHRQDRSRGHTVPPCPRSVRSPSHSITSSARARSEGGMSTRLVSRVGLRSTFHPVVAPEASNLVAPAFQMMPRRLPRLTAFVSRILAVHYVSSRRRTARHAPGGQVTNARGADRRKPQKPSFIKS